MNVKLNVHIKRVFLLNEKKRFKCITHLNRHLIICSIITAIGSVPFPDQVFLQLIFCRVSVL